MRRRKVTTTTRINDILDHEINLEAKMKSKIFELCPGGKVARLVHITHTDTSFLELVDTKEEKTITVNGLDGLKELRDKLDKFIYMVEAMAVDPEASEGHVSDLYGNSITIDYALEHNLLKKR